MTHFFLDNDCGPLYHSVSSHYISTHADSSQLSLSPFEELKELRMLHPRKVLATHLNINSLKSKFDDIYELLNEKLVDLLFISETKLASSYHDNLFEVQGYKLERQEQNLHAFIRSDIPARRKNN